MLKEDDAVAYIVAHLKELKRIANKGGHGQLAYLIEIAELEAFEMTHLPKPPKV